MADTNLVLFEEVDKRIIEIRTHKVLLDSDVAQLYGVETRDINKAVSNNPGKFPDGYILELNQPELDNLRWKISTAKLSKTRVMPKAFTEKGLYMLATILKSAKATQTTIAIIEVYSRIKNLSRNLKELSNEQDERKKQSLLKRSGEMMLEVLKHDLNSDESETSVELNFAVLKLKHTIKRKKK